MNRKYLEALKVPILKVDTLFDACVVYALAHTFKGLFEVDFISHSVSFNSENGCQN